MLKVLLLSAAMTAGLTAPSFAQTRTPSTSPSAPAATMPVTPPITAPAPGAIKGSTLINMDVKNTADEKIGDINDVIVSADGKVQQVIISVGGFLGVGSRKVAVAWNDVKVDANADVARVNMSRERLQVAPEFKDRRTTP